MFIGTRAIKITEETNETTPGGTKIIKVTYEDDHVEHFSQLMYDKVISEEACTLDQLRDKRCEPVAALMLSAFREWGVPFGDLDYISQLANRSLIYNQQQAICLLWSDWMPKPLSVEDVTIIAMDRLLKAKSPKVENA